MKLVSLLVALSLVLAACSAVPQVVSNPAGSTSTEAPSEQPDPTATLPSVEAALPSPEIPSTAGQSVPEEDLVRIDEQGAVVVAVTPVNLNNAGEALEFEVALDTHSVDLSMDLGPLAVLTTDSGKTVQASQWDAPRGGHHVSGKLIFPAAVEGQPLLEGAKELTLTISDLDAPQRIFSWALNP